MTSIYGDLDVSNQCHKRIYETLITEWKEKKVRYRIEDINRIKKYLKETNKNIRETKRVLQDFEKIV